MRKIFLSLAALAVICITMNACKPADNETPTGKVKLEFNNVVGGSNLNMNSQWYKNAHGDSFQVSKFNYYISNIQLNGPDGAAYTEADSYHLLQQSDVASLSFDMASVPAKRYNSITLTIGVDSLHNVSGAQQGALDPSNGMYWSWNTGYIMLKFEGISPQSTEAGGMLMMHAGGFAGVNSTVKTITLNFPDNIDVTGTAVPHVHLQADVLSLFKAPNMIDFSTLTTIHMPGTDAGKLAANYANMFTVTYAGL